MRKLPAGTVTFLFTDIEGSTKLLHELGADRYAQRLAEHRRVLREAFARHGGVEVDTQGDAFFVAFPTAPEALEAAREAQKALEIPVRMGIHTGTPLQTEEGYVGADVHRAARIAAAGHGGQVLVSASTASLLGASDSLLLDLGEHRLKDLSAPERIWQLGEAQFPRLKTLYQTNLPVPATAFLGREAELAQTSELLLAGVRLLTLSGPGGTGKTRLALQAAGAVADDYPDGIWWVPLASLADPSLVLPSAEEALGAKRDLADEIGDKRLLLLLDNFEHLIEAATDIATLIGSCPNLTVLVTSRERLQLAGEHEYPVPALAAPDGLELFSARARAHGVELDGDPAAGELCERLDNLPLALELAAARTKLFSPAQLLERLGQRLDLFKGGRDADPRQRTLRATIEWSYELLALAEQELFARLSVFAGGCTYAAAEAICGADEDTLQSLLDKSVLRRGGNPRDEPRYWMLETIREYAAELLEASPEGEGIRRSHAEFFLGVAGRLDEAFASNETAREASAIRAAEGELDNFRAASSWFIERGEAEDALGLTAGLMWFWFRTDRIVEGRSWGERALGIRQGADVATEARARYAVGSLSAHSGDVDRAEELLSGALTRFMQLGDKPWIARTLDSIADLYLIKGDLEAARVAFEESLAAFAAAERPRGVVAAKHGLGQVHRDLGNFEAAQEFLREAVAAYRAEGDYGGVVSALHSLGDLELDRRKLDEAERCYAESLGLVEEHGLAQRQAGYCVAGLACVAAARDHAERAGELWAAVERIEEEIGSELVGSERVRYERILKDVDKAAFEAGVSAGREMPLSRALNAPSP